MIHATGGKLHWNYFLALERDLEVVSRYVEFTEANFRTFSIELAHILFAAASEVDVLSKLLCEKVSPGSLPEKPRIDQYRPILKKNFPDLPVIKVFVPRYGLSFKPWENWTGKNHPDWWQDYNKVKHSRHAHFERATLHNALNALGGLLILTYNYYRLVLAVGAPSLDPKDTMQSLQPQSTLLRLSDDHYHELVWVG
jgi:hypothetical protein